MDRVISNDELSEFLDRGVVVIRNVLSQEYIDSIRTGFHKALKDLCDFDDGNESVNTLMQKEMNKVVRKLKNVLKNCVKTNQMYNKFIVDP